MRQLYDISRWKEHRKTSHCCRNKGSYSSLTSFFAISSSKSKGRQPSTPDPQILVPCPGLTAEHYPKVGVYLSRTSALGGGAPSRIKLAARLFNSSWKELSSKQKQAVRRREELLFEWVNRHACGAVFSTSCATDVYTADPLHPEPCTACSGLLKNKRFKSAIHRPPPEKRHLKYVPKLYRSEELGRIFIRYHGARDLVESVSHVIILHVAHCRSQSRGNLGAMAFRFAVGVSEGKYTQQEVFLGSMQVLMEQTRRAALGRRLSGITYPPEFDHVCSILATVSPRAYSTFREHFGGRNLRSMR